MSGRIVTFVVNEYFNIMAKNKSMNWDSLICDKRLGMEDYVDSRNRIRSDFQRDYDRLIFSSPFRRLQNKTQVFPLPGSIFVHNRLTHSLEVSGVGRSITNEVANALVEKYANDPWVKKLEGMGEIVAAACLAHDLGNPPFGHSGEKCIATYFSEGKGQSLRSGLSDAEWNDLIHFEGNANSFRLLTHQFNGRRKGGFAMTYSTLSAIVKYPYSSAMTKHGGKFGFFTSEASTYKKIAKQLGIIEKSENCYMRHPLVYLVEAADDICYQVMDIEDAHKLKILDTARTKELLTGFFEPKRKAEIERNMNRIGDKNEQIAYLRSCVIGELVTESAKVFVENEEAILRGEFEGCIMQNLDGCAKTGYAHCTEVAYAKIYNASEVVDIELAGNQIITFLMERLIDAVRYPEKNYSTLLLSKFPQQYDVNAPTMFGKIQAVIDHISGMTDVYALDLYRKLNGLKLPAV